jgi:hypothetical protein
MILMGSVTESAGGSSPRMGRRIVATGGVRPRRTEPVVIDRIVYPPWRGGGDVVFCARDAGATDKLCLSVSPSSSASPPSGRKEGLPCAAGCVTESAGGSSPRMILTIVKKVGAEETWFHARVTPSCSVTPRMTSGMSALRLTRHSRAVPAPAKAWGGSPGQEAGVHVKRRTGFPPSRE